MQKNLGTVDQYLRLVSGTIALVSAVQCRRNTLLQAALTTYGAMKVAEGVTGWCPLMHALGVRSTNDNASMRAGQGSAGPKKSPAKSDSPPQPAKTQEASDSGNRTMTAESASDAIATSYQ